MPFPTDGVVLVDPEWLFTTPWILQGWNLPYLGMAAFMALLVASNASVLGSWRGVGLITTIALIIISDVLLGLQYIPMVLAVPVQAAWIIGVALGVWWHTRQMDVQKGVSGAEAENGANSP